MPSHESLDLCRERRRKRVEVEEKSWKVKTVRGLTCDDMQDKVAL